MSVFVPEAQAQAVAVGGQLARRVREYYSDAGHRAEFERWYLEQYGAPYVWRKQSAANGTSTSVSGR